ncbi:MAG TPA: CehA/McbA family metallohydrolase [Tepidisphaeraceae bacterium]|jgi:hypothetical protein
MRIPAVLLAMVGITSASGAAAAPAAAPDRVTLELQVSEALGQPLPCRIHLADAAGKPQQSPGLPFWKDHFVCDGRAALELAPGPYTYQIERGPEYQRVSGRIELEPGPGQTIKIVVKRIADLRKQGWFCGDLHVHRPVHDLPLLMRAEDLDIAPVITWWNKTNLWKDQPIPDSPLRRFDGLRFYHVMAGEDERQGGALLYFNLDKPIDIMSAAAEYPSPMKFVAEARRRDRKVWIDIEKPFWWDVPVWLASGEMDSIGLANNHMQHGGMMANEAWGKPRDTTRLPGPLGNGWWSQEIYYHLLNCGLRLPPSAGSASGVLANPVGYNRVYVHLNGELEYDKWWQGLKEGRCFVTNGPLLLCTAQGELPGHVFQIRQDKPLELQLDLRLISQDAVPRIEIIKNGRVDQVINLDDAQSHRRAAAVSFREGGWFLARAVAGNRNTFRFASTGPFYVESGESKPRISRTSAQFFVDWVAEREKRIRAKDLPDDQLGQIMEHQEMARRFWQERLDRANAE